MPELPEVETIRREVLPFVKGRRIVGLEVGDPRNLKGITPTKLRAALENKKILDIERRAKYLLFPLSPPGYLIIHLGMTGRLLFSPDKYVKLVFELSGRKKLFFSDARLFGKIRYSAESPKLVLGPEPLTPAFTLAKLKEALSKKKSAVKLVLLDQKVISGIGNIYANEILFRAAVHPKRPASSLTGPEINRLFFEIKAVLVEAIKYRGTSDNWYVDAKGEKGSFQNRLKVYRKKGAPCPKCGTAVVRISLGQRGTFFCPKCQQ